MHSTADSTGPGIVIKAILSKRLSFQWLKVFLITISIKGHHLPFTYLLMSLKMNLDKSNFRFYIYPQRGMQDTNCKRSSYIHHPTMCLSNLDAEGAGVGVESNGKSNKTCNYYQINISILCIPVHQLGTAHSNI